VDEKTNAGSDAEDDGSNNNMTDYETTSEGEQRIEMDSSQIEEAGQSPAVNSVDLSLYILVSKENQKMNIRCCRGRN